jgi:hypothetical protein
MATSTVKIGTGSSEGGQITISTSGTAGNGTPSTGYGSIYYGDDKQLRLIDDTGAITVFGPGGGTSGGSGSSGTSGTSGSRGTSGTSGGAGAAGTSGTSGVNGSVGSSGQSGTSGSSGSSGSSGQNGTSGSSGANGSSGSSGSSGATTIFVGTSTSSFNISNGVKTFTTQLGLNFVAGQTVSVAHDGANFMVGVIQSYVSNTGALTVNVTYHEGTGTYNAWDIAISSVPGTSGSSGQNGSSGSSGSTGSSGSSGLSGSAGSSGSSGQNGTAGTSGETF